MLLRALEDKSFLPVGSDRAASSDFQLIAGTNRELLARVRAGEFREDLLARINLWTFELPGLWERPEDLEPNLDYELERWDQQRNQRVSMNREARELFLSFALSPQARWLGSFRDFNAAVTRMATLAPGGRIDVPGVRAEIERLLKLWSVPRAPDEDAASSVLSVAQRSELDRFDQVQLAEVVRVCRSAKSLSEAGRVLFAVSRAKKEKPNDADRLRKYLARFGLDWEEVKAG
jgi:transcriptional regulatory protein RtcR